MFKKITIFLILSTMLCVNAFANTATVENSGNGRYKSVRLTPQIYNNANADLSDILIFDDSGEPVPYFINSGNVTDYEVGRREYPMLLINSYTKDNSFYFDYKVRDIPSGDVTATSLEFMSQSTGFAKEIELYGSYDNVNWEFVQNDTLYSIDGKSKLKIDFNKTQKYTHYRFKLGNNLEKISFTSVTLIIDYFTQEKINFVDIVKPNFVVVEKDKSTHINIDGLKNLKLCEITIETDSMFKRTVYSPFVPGSELYNLSFDDTVYNDTTIEYDWQMPNEDIFTLSIFNGDDKPINVTGITAKYYADELVFEDNGSKTYTVQFDADSTKSAPIYDVESYKSDIFRSNDEIDRLEIKSTVIEEVEQTEQRDYKLIFNIVVTSVALLLAVLILVRLRYFSK